MMMVMMMATMMVVITSWCLQAPEDPSAKPQVKANLGTLMGVYLPTIQVTPSIMPIASRVSVSLKFLASAINVPSEHLRGDPVHPDDLDCRNVRMARRLSLCFRLFGYRE